uniref:Protein FAR1-RELATED SEQUENCE n=1 Tax=Aegilops tauschii subsp. strangulata TaxID=200361 RepID=A0A453S385_AEGTS
MMAHEGEVKTVTIRDGYKKLRVVTYNTTTMVGSCTCKLFETHGIPCRHLIHVLRTAQVKELPEHYVLKRFRKECKKQSQSLMKMAFCWRPMRAVQLIRRYKN